MKTIYKCEYCGEEFEHSADCIIHEIGHKIDNKKIKLHLIKSGEDVCDYCDHSFYVYGCEFDCDKWEECRKSGGYQYFHPVKPLHNKYTNGGV